MVQRRATEPPTPRGMRLGLLRVLLLLLSCWLLFAWLSPRPALAAGPYSEVARFDTAVEPGVDEGAVAWGDFDNDGWPDFIVSGCKDGNYPCTAKTAIYRNNGASTPGSFQNMGVPLPQLSYASAAWGDHDNDGLLDFVVSGQDDGGAKLTRVYRGLGVSPWFTPTAISLIDVNSGSLAWGDYDNDGRLDLAISGYSGSGARTRIYRNSSDGSFSLAADLAPLYNSSLAWGDYNRDGLLDLVVMGRPSDAALPETWLYRNAGGGQFSDVSGTGLTAEDRGSLAWGDYDNDGFLDLLITGYTGTSNLTRVYRNVSGGGTFANLATLSSVDNGTVAWGDYDNDGFLDAFVGGLEAISETLHLFRNSGSSPYVFSEVSLGDLGLSPSSMSLGDSNRDGRLDVLVTGSTVDIPVTAVYSNTVPTANTPPSPPSGLSSFVVTDSVQLSWNATSDGQTAAAGLSYNVWMTRELSQGFIAIPLACLAGGCGGNGWRKVDRIGNAGHRTTMTIAGLTSGIYHWSVQAIDAAYAGGAFAAEGTFVIAVATPTPTATPTRDKHTYSDSDAEQHPVANRDGNCHSYRHADPADEHGDSHGDAHMDGHASPADEHGDGDGDAHMDGHASPADEHGDGDGDAHMDGHASPADEHGRRRRRRTHGRPRRPADEHGDATATNTWTATPIPPTARHGDEHADTAGEHAHGNADSNQHADSADEHGDGDAHMDGHADPADEHGHGDGDAHMDSHADPADGDEHGDEHADTAGEHAHGNADSNQHADSADEHGDGDAHMDGHADPAGEHAHGNADSDGHADPAGEHAHGNADSDQHADSAGEHAHGDSHLD